MTTPPLPSLLYFTLIGLPLLGGCSYSDAGTGTNTLHVKASLDYAAGDTDISHLQVEILDSAGQPVSDAAVTLLDGDTGEEFTLPEADSGIYRSDIPKYRRRAQLVIERGSDRLDGQLEGPGPHLIETPVQAGTVNRADRVEPLEVRWETTDGIKADLVTLGLDDDRFSTTETEDRGFATIPKDELHSGSEGVTVRRRNSLVFAAGLNHSSFEITYQVRHGFQVQD